jgi:Rps23 Pro-64 3,4-dihydroxylase Tpa1-like proline 4-hydroxylase
MINNQINDININKIFNFKNSITKYEHDTLIFKIDNIFNMNFAKLIYNTITLLPDKYWYNMSCFNNEYDKCKIINKNNKRINNFKNKANKSFIKDEFSFNFSKTMIYTQNEITKIELLLRNILGSNDFIKYLNKITNLNLIKLNDMFISKYKSGDFLAPHSDRSNGKLAYVINMSLNWKPQYGGNLHFMNNERTEIIHTLTPSFNNLVIFEVPDDGIPHYVSHIVPNLNKTRYAISGWFS